MRRTYPAGFTLVELLIAVALIALLSSMLFIGFRFGTRAVAAADDRIDRAAEIAVAYGFLEEALANARSLPQPEQSSDAPPSFVGTRAGLAFVTAPPAQLTLGGLHLLRLELEPSVRGSRLTVSWRLVSDRRPGDREPVELQPSVLIDKVASARFSYSGVRTPGRLPEWSDTWEPAAGLPRLVRIGITLVDGWQAPDFVVAPMAAQGWGN